MPRRAGQHPQGESNQGAALANRSAGAPCQRCPGHAEAYGVVSGIPKEIQRIGLQSRRTDGNAGCDLGREESGIDEQRLDCSTHRNARRRNKRIRYNRPCQRLRLA
jgi:hypothetical protein